MEVPPWLSSLWFVQGKKVCNLAFSSFYKVRKNIWQVIWEAVNVMNIANCILVNNMQFYKRLQICDKKRLTSKRLSWSYQRNITPLAKRLTNTPFFRFQIRAILVIESNFTKIEDHNYRLWRWYLTHTITWKTTSMNKSILTYKYSTLLPFGGNNFTSKNFKHLSLVETLFMTQTIVCSSELY